ncbi:hypothetical protein [Candidatus Uabimicrobium amorphum]|uniref:Uncharacterized protein n=1 Tax=Uabimicrobium amorphum TaxID=2596890 RepID=A0A5S9IIP8_UABAM|nr:hypothetical protein [Candidatus Uabimicrobium amorphum]BBM82579.1 hypothetical protein UABAM_00922 [Candidatus Uabimicrobium amorphum]
MIALSIDPVNREELHYILHNAQEALQLKLELDYLRDKFWKPESLQLINI